MEELTIKQYELSKQLKALDLAYEQLAEERKTLKLVEEKQTKIQEIWERFDLNDYTIRTDFSSELHHTYFAKDHYGQMEKLYINIREKLTAKQNSLKAMKPIEDPLINYEIKTNEKSSKIIPAIIKRCQRNQSSLKTLIKNLALEDQSREYYQEKIEQLREKWNRLREDDLKIMSEVDYPEQFNHDPTEIDEIENTVQELIIKLKERCTTATTNAKQEQVINKVVPGINLPTITIPKFDGNYLKWIQFRDMFYQMVDQQPHLKNIEKMFYLKMNLSGEAEKLIRHLTVTESNYTIAWEILTKRYDNKRLLIATILDRLINQPNIAAGSARALKFMYDTTQECIMMLENLELKVVDNWDPIVVHILVKKLDKDSHAQYEQLIENPKQIQTLKNFMSFIESRFQSMDALGVKQTFTSQRIQRHVSNTATTNTDGCIICNKPHTIHNCEKFKSMQLNEREAEIRKHKLCFNCFRKGHSMNKCLSYGCKVCKRKHNILLHRYANDNTQKELITHQERIQTTSTQGVSNIAGQNTKRIEDNQYVFLGTALLAAYGKNNKKVDCRVLLDSGSQLNFISERLHRQLGLDSQTDNINICGIGKASLTSSSRVNLKISSNVGHYETNIEAHVIKEITTLQPQRFVKISQWPLKNVELADPCFNIPKRVDLLLGAEMYAEFMRSGQIKIGPNLPTLQKTVFGWMVLGKVNQGNPPEAFAGVTNEELDQLLLKFWSIEEVKDQVKVMSRADQMCEEYFKNTTMRDETGRFEVNLPILGTSTILGESKQIAFRRFLRIEEKLRKNKELKLQYEDFMSEYETLGHMQEIPADQIPLNHYFIPHHCVIRPENTSTKLRVVFDASCKTSSNLSLNDIMLKGPNIQDELFNILLRFRTYKYVITADIRHMYRQIKIADEDQKLQMIMWRKNPSDQIRYYKLKTVTYGTKAAPYLAIRCLKQLAEDESIKYPLAAEAIKDFYVDDVITGCDTLTELRNLKRQLIDMLDTAKFPLHKWASNQEEIINDITPQKRETEKIFEDEPSGYIKTLGLSWFPAKDFFTFTTMWPTIEEKLTKRKIVSETAKLFDPLGLASPVVIRAKIIIQKLWRSKVDWDDEVNESMQNEWSDFRRDLAILNYLKIGRYVLAVRGINRFELHGFSDASQEAYGAVIYCRTIDSNGMITTKLLCSKSRVAPLKMITIPRLELCAAKLLTKLMERVKSAIKRAIDETYYWTDSKNVLSWIQGEPALYKTYVANRVGSILDKSASKEWNYVNTKTNPADLVSRGEFADILIGSEVWFQGPSFLSLREEEWPNRGTSLENIENEEKKFSAVAANSHLENGTHPLYCMDHKNSLNHLVRCMAYLLRAVERFKKNPVDLEENLSTNEIDRALTVIIKEVQTQCFEDDIAKLKKKQDVNKQSTIRSLSPFLDLQGVLRVGGRLDNASISYNAQHPILLPKSHFVSKLIMNNLHLKHLHAAPLALVAISRQNFWIIQAKNIARAVVSNCVECTKMNPKVFQQRMGNLPEKRILPARPFLHAGVDFLGPIMTHYHIRGKKPTKSYIAIFCCFATKAVHMEVVSDLTAEGFIGALRRFMSRRGICKDLFCDNATNFVGTNNILKRELSEIEKILTTVKDKDKIVRTCQDQGVQFHFIPPRSPHFGGLWEAAVKSAKKLIKKVVLSAALTFEEVCTVAAEAEAILNSRPLTPMSADPNDLIALTPGHFLIGEPLTSIPPANVEHENLSNLTRWKLVSAIRTEFWKRWSTEYLSELQKRHKWTETNETIKPGMLVLVKEDNIIPLKWPMGRIQEVIYGKDGLVRIAIVKTTNGLFKRAIHNLAPLPVGEEKNDENSANTSREGNNNRKRNNESSAESIKRTKCTSNSRMS